MSEPDDALRALVGVTAGGKSELALELAESAGAEVLSLDSMQVYRGLDIGTAKPGAAERARVRHHLIDLVEPSERYDVQRYLSDAAAVEGALRSGGRPGFFAGGTILYLKALTHGLFQGPPHDPALRGELLLRARGEGGAALHAELAALDPASAVRLHPHDTRRVVRALEVLRQTGRTLSSWQREWRGADGPAAGRPRRLFGIEVDPSELDRRIALRTARMLDSGWVEEALAVERGPGFGPTAAQALGYAEALALGRGEIDRAAAEVAIRLRTRQFARRQRTWLRKFPEIAWIAAPHSALERERAAQAARAHFAL